MYDLHGLRQAYRPKICRRWTLTLRNPVPTGVVMGALRPTRVRRMLARSDSGSGVPYCSRQSIPASCTSHRMAAPVASITSRATAASSGPVPSPIISVTS